MEVVASQRQQDMEHGRGQWPERFSIALCSTQWFFSQKKTSVVIRYIVRRHSVKRRMPRVFRDPRLLFFPLIGEVVLHKPGLAAVIRTLAELPDLVRPQLDELQVSFQLSSVRLRNFIRPIVHRSVLQSPIEKNVATGVVHPILLPPLERRVVNVVALPGVSDIARTYPVFLNHAISQDQFDSTISRRCLSLARD